MKNSKQFIKTTGAILMVLLAVFISGCQNGTTDQAAETAAETTEETPAATYTVTYNANGAETGTVPSDSAAYEEGNTVTVLGNTGELTKTNYILPGWNTRADGSGTTYKAGSTFTIGDADVSLYALWSFETIIYDDCYSVAKSTCLDDSGNIYATGYSWNGSNYDMVIWNYDSSGVLDTGFGSGGIVVHDSAAGGSYYDRGYSICLDDSGNIYVTGFSNNGNNSDMVIWKYDSAGVLDTDFGSGGIVVHDSAAGGSSYDTGYSICLDDSGNIYVTGYSNKNSSNSDMVIWKYDSAGVLDTGFGSGGIVVHDSAAGGSGSDIGYSICLDDSGNIYVTGFSNNGNNSDMVIWKYDSAGVLDTDFGSGGIAVHDSAAGGSGSDIGYSICLDDSGNIYVTGYSNNNSSNSDMVIWKYDSAGVLDTGFGSDGIVVHDSAAGGSSYDYGFSICLDDSGNIYVTGNSYNESNTDMVIWKYDSAGVLDTSFGTDGVIIRDNIAGGSGSDYGYSICLDDAGNIYTAGDSVGVSTLNMVICKIYQ